MKRIILFALVLLTLASDALPQATTMANQRVWDAVNQVWVPQRGDANGTAYMTDPNALLPNGIARQQNWKQGVLVAGNKDSTTAANVLGAKRLNVYLYGIPDSMTRAAIVGVTVYLHHAGGTSDTLTRAIWQRKPTGAFDATTAARNDSIGAFLGVITRTGGIADSTLAFGETPWVIEGTGGTAAKNRQFPPMFVLPLIDRNGASLQAERISLGLRFYKAYDGTNYSAGTATTRTVRYTIHLEAVR